MCVHNSNFFLHLKIIKKLKRSTAIIIFLISLFGILNLEARAKSQKKKVPLKALMEKFYENAGNYDALSLRIILKKISKQLLNYNQWSEIRKYLIMNPQVGYDIIYKWENLRPNSPIENEMEKGINDSIEKADQLTVDEKFEEAFKIYQSVALFLKGEIKKGKKENIFLYSVMVHSMGRSLFGSGRFTDALEVYGWLPKNYPRLRQVMYEKMWTAFRAGRIDIAKILLHI